MDVYFDDERPRAIFEAATEAFVEIVAGIASGQWDGPGLDRWTLRELVGHTSRALLTIELYLARGAETITLDSPVAYVLAAGAATATAAGADAVTQRGRDAGLALGNEPAAAVKVIAERVISLVDRTADDAPCATPAGAIALAAYLPTRTLELTVHTLDIAAATGTDAPDALAEPVRACLDLLAATIGATAAAPGVLLALTGRRPLPADLHVI